MSIKEEMQETEEELTVEFLEKKLARTLVTSDNRRKDSESLKRQLLAATNDRDRLNSVLEGIQTVSKYNDAPPKWSKPKKSFSKHQVTPFLMLSDLHLDEVVDKSEVYFWNEYNREIAKARLERIINQTVEMSRTYINGFTYDGIVLILGGDIISGNIHDEFIQTNHGTIMETIIYWVPQLASAIEHLADEFGSVYVPCIRGNHDRYSEKKQVKKSTQESFSFIVYNWLADRFRDDKRITFNIASGIDLPFQIYDKNYLLTHGDYGFSGGNGVAGIYPGIKKGLDQRFKRNSQLGEPFDYLCIGHWHQYIVAKDLIVNSSLKGYDEFAASHTFSFEKPSQAMWLQSPERGITMHLPIWAD